MKRPALRSIHPTFENYFSAGLPVRLHVRSDLHLARKTWHMLMGLAIAFIYMSGISATLGVVILASILGLDLLMESARLNIPSLNEKILRVWGPLMRTCEAKRMSTVPHYLAA